MSELILSDNTFETEVVQSSVPVLVDFWAPWCGPCKIQGPIVEELAQEFEDGKAKVGKLNVDENPATSEKYNVLSIPTLAIFKGGVVVEQFVGVQSRDTLKTALGKYA